MSATSQGRTVSRARGGIVRDTTTDEPSTFTNVISAGAAVSVGFTIAIVVSKVPTVAPSAR